MILPSAVQVTKASDLEAQRDGTDSPMIRQGAVIGKSDKMCATGRSFFICLVIRHISARLLRNFFLFLARY
jgi:hypothetical protein